MLFIPETHLFLRHEVGEEVVLLAGLDAAAVRHGALGLAFPLAVLQAAGVPPYAQLQVALAGRPHRRGVRTSRERGRFYVVCGNVRGRKVLDGCQQTQL